MKILMLSANTGGGHNVCSAALAEKFDEHNVEYKVKDCMKFKGTSGLVTFFFILIYRYAPIFFRLGYKFTDRHRTFFNESLKPIRSLSNDSKKLHDYIVEEGYDTVICTHVFAAAMLTEAIERYGTDVKSCFIATDYTLSPGGERSRLETYCIPAEAVRKEMIKCGIDEDKLVVTGIPVREVFYQKNEAAREKYNIPPGHKHLLVMSGSMGAGPIRRITRQLREKLDDDMIVTIICGTNKKLRWSLNHICKGDERFRVIGYTDEVSLLMDSADLYFTKPGGISVTEALVKRLPMMFINAVGGCEEYNRKFFVDNGFAQAGREIEETAQICVELLRNTEELKKMRSRMEKTEQRYGAQAVYELMCQNKQIGEEK